MCFYYAHCGDEDMGDTLDPGGLVLTQGSTIHCPVSVFSETLAPGSGAKLISTRVYKQIFSRQTWISPYKLSLR